MTAAAVHVLGRRRRELLAVAARGVAARVCTVGARIAVEAAARCVSGLVWAGAGLEGRAATLRRHRRARIARKARASLTLDEAARRGYSLRVPPGAGRLAPSVCVPIEGEGAVEGRAVVPPSGDGPGTWASHDD